MIRSFLDTRSLAAASVFLAAVLATPLAAQELCTLDGGSENSVLAMADLTGPEACEEFCRETINGCVGWSIQPHTMNPDTVPTTCRAFDVVDEQAPSDAWYCGLVDD